MVEPLWNKIPMRSSNSHHWEFGVMLKEPKEDEILNKNSFSIQHMQHLFIPIPCRKQSLILHNEGFQSFFGVPKP